MPRSNQRILAVSPRLAGVERLFTYRDLTINGVTVSPMFAFRGVDATLTQWVCAQTGTVLSIAGAGSDPTINGHGPYLDDRSVAFQNAKYYTAPNNTFGDIATEDFCVEAVSFIPTAGVAEYWMGHYNGTGYLITRSAGSTNTSLFWRDGATAKSTLLQPVVATWNHEMWFVNVSENSVNGSVGYLNTVAGSGTNPSGLGSLSAATPFQLGAANASAPCATYIAWLAAWKLSNWFAAGAAGPAEWAIIARQRMALWTGNRALYQANDTTTPSSL